MAAAGVRQGVQVADGPGGLAARDEAAGPGEQGQFRDGAVGVVDAVRLDRTAPAGRERAPRFRERDRVADGQQRGAGLGAGPADRDERVAAEAGDGP